MNLLAGGGIQKVVEEVSPTPVSEGNNLFGLATKTGVLPRPAWQLWIINNWGWLGFVLIIILFLILFFILRKRVK
jgi:hypothetical protein